MYNLNRKHFYRQNNCRIFCHLNLESHVILESPVYPVIEGENMALHCRKKDSTSNYTAKFYKNSISIGSSSSGNIMIPTVSKSDGGLYKCSIVDTGDSPESWLNIKGALYL